MIDYVSPEMQKEEKGKAAKKRGEEIAQSIVKDFEQIQQLRANHENQWQEIAERIDPVNTRNFNTNAQEQTKGDKRTQSIYDSTATIACGRFAAILDSLLTPRNQTWHKLTASIPELAKSRDVRLYFEETNRLLFKYRYAPKANFSSQNQQNYWSLGAYGTGCMFIDDLAGAKGLRYKNIHLSQIFFVENHQGIIDHAIRHFPFTARQAIQKWGENCPDKIKEVAKNNPNQEFYFLHCVKPRTDYDPFRRDFKGMPFASYYVAMCDKSLLGEGGYNTFPYAPSRYVQANNEVYGRSPAGEVLPSIKSLNEQKKALLKQGHRVLDPVLLVHDDGIVSNYSAKPGSMVPGGVNAQGQPLVHALPTGNIQAGKETMDDERTVINDAFLISLFQILTENPEMTATEVMERSKEKGILLAPTVGRQHSEYLGPMIERELDCLARQMVLPEMPQELIEARGQYDIIYDSPLSRAQRAEEASGIMRTIEAAMNVAANAQKPEVLDYFNWDMIIPQMADIQGVPQSWLNSPEIVANLRAQRQQQINAQMTQNALPGTAAMVKSVAAASKAG